MKALFAIALLAGSPGIWDCIGLTDTEISVMMAYDDYDDYSGLPNCDKGEPGHFGAPGSPSSDNEPQGPGVHV